MKTDCCEMISVLVPIYNVENYLKRCIDSIINQTYENWELILIDDGSTDNSGAMCDKYAETDKRIMVVHKKNGGLASARLAGLKIATGKWLMFLDSDDYLEHDTLRDSVNAAIENESDLVRFGMIFRYYNKSVCYSLKNYSTKEEHLCAVISRMAPVCVCGALYSRDLFNKINPTFVDGINFGEDYCVFGRILSVSNNPIILNRCYYNYTQTNTTSYVRFVKWDYMEQFIAAEKINYDYFTSIDKKKYLPFLKMGRASVKAHLLRVLYGNYNEFRKYEEYVLNIYNDCVSLKKLGPIDYFICSASEYRFGRAFLRLFIPARNYIGYMARKILY